jgi:molecular chaperone DnaK
MVKDAEKFAEEDKKRRAKAEARNQADSLVHSTEKQLAEHGEKVDASVKSEIESAIADVKAVLDGDDVDAINAKTQALAQAAMKLGEAIYKAEQEGAAAAGEPSAAASADDDVVDAEFQEVDDDKKA